MNIEFIITPVWVPLVLTLVGIVVILLAGYSGSRQSGYGAGIMEFFVIMGTLVGVVCSWLVYGVLRIFFM